MPARVPIQFANSSGPYGPPLLSLKSNGQCPQNFKSCSKRVHLKNKISDSNTIWWGGSTTWPSQHYESLRTRDFEVDILSFKSKSSDQDLNQWEDCPLDFESNAVTTQPTQLWLYGPSKLLLLLKDEIWDDDAHRATATMAEWLRRYARNPMGSARTGSNPVHFIYFWTIKYQTQNLFNETSVAPTIKCVEDPTS